MLFINGLNIGIKNSGKTIHILRDVSLSVQKGEILGIGGESGSGKTILAKTVLGLLSRPVRKLSGEIIFEGKPLETEKDFRSVRGKNVSMIFQNPTASLNPVMKIGTQITEAIRAADKSIGKAEARRKAEQLLREVEIDYPSERLESYPHQLSGGMNQRAMIAIALASNPELLIADEPTTALDVTIQKQIIDLLLKLNKEKHLSIIFITHDLSLMQAISHRCVILYAGEIMEKTDSENLRENRIRHPYTFSLKKCLPTLEEKNEQLYSIPGVIDKNTEEYDNSCVFHKRCFNRIDKCLTEKPKLTENRPFACHNPL
ncbi:ABC transporter ATP-binding protein [Geovibrio thiophilus]|uniref:ABC transporter ATP-binding protein n=1 Tax=Geovibrio thiophilus TaxID=139438 RepID=A0A3R5XWN9_9BACT|nr:ABC transporter ATP-binding protein [Geovibrio thiophilus]